MGYVRLSIQEKNKQDSKQNFFNLNNNDIISIIEKKIFHFQ